VSIVVRHGDNLGGFFVLITRVSLSSGENECKCDELGTVEDISRLGRPNWKLG
jgi:hypothetical protein